jgi:hypothetical protein
MPFLDAARNCVKTGGIPLLRTGYGCYVCQLHSIQYLKFKERNMIEIKELKFTHVVKTRKHVHRSVMQLVAVFFAVYEV